MFTSWLSRCALIFFSCSYLGLAYAYSEPTKNDPLQSYRDEIKQAETNASQAVLDTLKSNPDADGRNAQQIQPLAEPSLPPPARSNKDKAFTPSTGSTGAAATTNKNPWLKPNPWVNQTPNIWERNAKINPYSNAPIPGPTPPTNPSSVNSAIIPSPPNIFAPPQQTTKPSDK